MTQRIFAEAEFDIHFAGEGLLTAEHVGNSVLAWGQIYQRIPKILSGYDPAFARLISVPYVEELDHGSMTLRVLLRLICKTAEDAQAMEDDIAALNDLAKKAFFENIQRMNPAGKSIVSAIVGGTVVWGALHISGYLDRAERDTISNQSGIVINQSAVQLNITPAAFTQLLDDGIRDNKTLVRQTIQALTPAKALDQGHITIGEDGQAITLDGASARIIARTRADELKPRTETRRHQDEQLIIRALDLDKTTTGWAGVIPSISPNRIRLTLDPSVQITAPGAYTATLDLDVQIDLDGNEKPKVAHILRLN